MSQQAWITLGVLVTVLVFLVRSKQSPDVILIGGLSILTVLGVVSPFDALSGFSNEGVITIAVLFAVATGLRNTGAMNWLGNHLLGKPRSILSAQSRIMFPTALASGFMNNTPLVTVLLPVVSEWARRHRISASKLLIPLSFASILGGTCTLIGTSTNLIINGWLMKETGHPGLDFFEVTKVGLPCVMLGIGFILLAGKWLLPDRTPPISRENDPRSYTVETMVDEKGPFVGKTIEEAGLRNLPGLYLMEIERGGEVIPAVGPTQKLFGGDRLVFVGMLDSLVDLHKMRGLIPAAGQVFKMDAPRSQRLLIEAVVSDSCPLVGRSIREGRFRTHYNAVIIAVARNGRRIPGRIGDIILQPGDNLLLEAQPRFTTQQRYRRDFYLVSNVKNSQPPQYERAPVALMILAALVITVTMGWLSMLKAALLAAGLMLFTRCSSVMSVRRSIDWVALFTIAASIGLGKAMQVSGLADSITRPLLTLGGDDPRIVLAIIYGSAMVLSAMVGSKAGAVLVLPVAFVASGNLNVDVMPFVMAVLFASSTSLATPIGYPSNMMIYGPGGYRYSDYLRMGVPLSILLWGLCTYLIPVFWPFYYFGN